MKKLIQGEYWKSSVVYFLYINKVQILERREQREREKQSTRQNLKTKAEVLRKHTELSVGVTNMGEVVLLVDDLRSLSGISRCRICHEEEFESSKSLEAPCACSGTVKVKPEFL